jgi:hypothetical protein
MKIFIWESVSKLTSSRHSGGGLTVLADTLDMARALVKAQPDASACTALTDAPDAEFEVIGEHEPKVWIFPNAGCC